MIRRPAPSFATTVAIALVAALLVLALAPPQSALRAQIAPISPLDPGDALAPRPDAARVYPIAARFTPGEEAAIAVESLSPTGTPLVGPIELTFFHLHQELFHAVSDPVMLLPDAVTTVEFRWTPPPTDFTGY